MIVKPPYLLRALAGLSLAAFGAVLMLVPVAAVPQSPNKDAGPPFNDSIEDPAEWGKAFPKQYEDYKKSTDMPRTKHGGSEAVPRTPTQAGSALGRRRVQQESRRTSGCARRSGRATRSHWIFARSAATPTCSRTRTRPSA